MGDNIGGMAMVYARGYKEIRSTHKQPIMDTRGYAQGINVKTTFSLVSGPTEKGVNTQISSK